MAFVSVPFVLTPVRESFVTRTACTIINISLTPGARVSCGTVARQRMRGVVACPPVFTRIRFTRKQLCFTALPCVLRRTLAPKGFRCVNASATVFTGTFRTRPALAFASSEAWRTVTLEATQSVSARSSISTGHFRAYLGNCKIITAKYISLFQLYNVVY
ncbi:hypothetical protein NP493_77g02027 [Ridgeia piscesae]|uniref:Uncharacterized protein n=1 Tax=Ridgeia piscesae TaxID=27915 RepID=A0AAD9UI86_RIDPI|nr:hypothetical protein NP493_77g02027 [Ridgeia piscesae]